MVMMCFVGREVSNKIIGTSKVTSQPTKGAGVRGILLGQ